MKPSRTNPAALVAAALILLSIRAGALEPPSAVELSGLNASLYPIGWSRDGKFAYALVDQSAFRRGYGFVCSIVDSRTDEVLWSRYDHSDSFEWNGEGIPLAAAWERNVAAISEELAAFGIEQLLAGELEPFPMQRGSDEYAVVVGEWRTNPEKSPYGNGVVGYTVTFRSRERGSKVIAQQGQIFATDIRVHGFLRSPFENRIVLLLVESGNAYGGNRFSDFTFIGAHLDAGFE